MRDLFYFIVVFQLLIGCGSETDGNKVTVPLGEVGILVDSNGKVLSHELIKEGTYTFKDSVYKVISFPVFVETSISSSFITRDSKRFTGYMTIDYILDTTKVFEMYNAYSQGYYEVEYEPNLKRIFRETIERYSSDSLRNEYLFNQFYDSLTYTINRDLSKEYFFITELKIDSVIERKHDNPFKQKKITSQ